MEEDATNLYEDAIGAVRLRQYFLGGLESRGSAMDDSKLTGTIVPISEIFLILKIGGPDTLFDNIQKLDRHSVENMFLYLRNVAWDLNWEFYVQYDPNSNRRAFWKNDKWNSKWVSSAYETQASKSFHSKGGYTLPTWALDVEKAESAKVSREQVQADNDAKEAAKARANINNVVHSPGRKISLHSDGINLLPLRNVLTII